MWKAAFTGRSESGGGSAAGRPSKEEPRRKKSGHSHRAESVVSAGSRRDDDKDKERRRRDRPGSLYDNASSASRYENGSSYTSGGGSQYATAPSSRVGESRPLTESALRMLPDDEEEWEDEEKDARSEKRSKRKESGDEKRRKSTRSEKERSRSRSREGRDKKRESKSDKSRDKDRDRSRRDPKMITENSRAIPEMGSFEQFPGQYGPPGRQDAVMSGALPSPAPNQQFPGQDAYARPPMRPSQPTREDSFGAAAEYYLDEGQSVHHQPGVRPLTPNMLVNPDLDHLMAASAEAHPAADTGNGSAQDFFSGKVSPVPYETPQKPTKPGKQSSSSRPSKTGRTSSIGTAAAAIATAAGIGALSGSNHHHSSSQQQTATSSSSFSSKPTSRPPRHNSDGSVYYAPPSSNSTYPPTLPSTNGYGRNTPTQTGNPGKRPTNSNLPLYAGAAAAAGAAGYAAYEHSQHSQYNGQASTSYNMAAGGSYGGGGQGPPRSPQPGAGGYSHYPSNGSNGGMAQMPYHEHKGPITRLKDGLFNLVSSPEDTAKMEMYTEYIGVCKHCFDPRTSAWDAPRVHHYHKRQDSFEDLRRRRSYDKMRRQGSDESLRRKGSTRVDKENRYYASESSRKKRESGGAGILGAGLAAAGAAGVANAMFSDRKDFDDTYSVKSGHRESSAVRRRSRSSSREQRRRSTYGVARPDKEEYVTVRKKDGTVERRKVVRKSRSTSRDCKSSGLFGATATGAALGAAGMAASSRRRSRSRSPSVLGGSDVRSWRRERRSPNRASYYDISRHDERPRESEGFFGGFFSAPQKTRRDSHEHRKKRRGFFTFSNSSESSHDDLAFGEGFASRTSLPLRRKSSTVSNRTGRSGRRASRKKSDEHLAATVAGIGATAAALAAAQKGHRISKRTSRPELGKRREPRYDTRASTDDEWEDELPSDVDDESSVDGGLAFGDYGGKRLSSRQSMESVGSQSSAGGPLSAWGWRWRNKEQKRRGKRTSSPHQSHPTTGMGSFVAPGLSTAGSVSGASFDSSRPINKPVYLDDTGRPLPSISSESTTTSGPQGPMQYVDPAPMSDAGSRAGSRHPSMPGAFEDDPPVVCPGPGPIQQPQPITPIQPAFTQSPPDMYSRPGPRRANSSPTRGHFAQDAALIGAAALGTAGIIAGSSMASGRKSRESSNVRFGLTEEQQRKEDRDQRKEQKTADEERRKADRTRALKAEAERAAKEARQEEIRQAREDENRRRAEEKLREQREAEERAERERQKEQARVERERLEREARHRQEAAAAAAAEVERLRLEREEAQRQAELRERERLQREEADEREQRRLADERERHARDQDSNERYERGRKGDENRHSSASKWAPVAVGAAAAATVGAVMASEKGRDRKRRDDSYYDQAHSGQTPTRNYGTEEVKPKYEHEGEPIMDDDIFDPELFKRKHRDSSAPEELENDPQYIEFARRAADKIAADRERAYSPAGKDKYTTYADFFMPQELLDKSAEKGSKVRDVSPNADNEIAVWHARDDDIRSHFPHYPSDYGYGRSKHAPYGVPKLNVISPTPPLESQSPTSARSSKSSKPHSPLAKAQDVDDDEVPSEPTKSQASGKSERSRSISWGEDKTHFYDIDTPTPESHMDRDSYITSPDMRGQSARAAAGFAGAAVAGAALHDIIVEDPSGESHRYSEQEWLRDEKKNKSSRGRKVAQDDQDDVEDITPSPEPQPDRHGFYRQPFFDSVSDMGTGIFDIDSPGTEGAPPVRGFVEGEVDETPTNEKAPHIPGGFDDDDDPVSAEIKKEQVAQAAVRASKDAEEQSAWQPPLSKKEKKKREKAAKRNSLAESDPPTPVTEVPTSNGISKDIAVGDEEYFPTLSKKDKKKLDKEAKKKGVGFADLVGQLQSEKETSQEPRREEQTVDDWEPPLSKKEQKKRDKEAKKSGFADVADEILAAGGIAAAAAAATGMASAATDSTEESAGGSSSSKKKKKGKKAKLGELLERDPRDLDLGNDVPPADPEVPSYAEEPSSMPGAWDDERRNSAYQSPGETTVDPFQYQVRDPEAVSQERPDAKEVDSWADWSEATSGKKSKKDKKKAKRGSAAFDTLPEVGSPLRAEVPQDDYMGRAEREEAAKEPISNGATSYVNGTSSSNGKPDVKSTPYQEDKPPDDRSARTTDFFKNGDRASQSSRQVSPDDVRSVTSAPEAGELRKSKREECRRGSDYADEPSYAYETQSVAASEPADLYDRERKSSKRRSRHADDFDDTASVTSSRSRREKEESPSSSKKESKGGLFGLFSRKSVDEKSSKDGSQLSRKSTRDEEDESRRRRKHRSTSEYGDDDDDTRSVKSESRRKHRSHSEHGDEESRERRKCSSRSYDDYDNDRSSPARSEPSSSHRHHHRKRTDDDGESLSRKDSRESRDAVSESGHRHHRRRRTDDDYDQKDQSFLGKRVEDLPPLPASPDDLDSAAAQERKVQQEQGEGSPVSAESTRQATVNPADGKVDVPANDDKPIEPSGKQLLQTPGQASSVETPQRPTSLGRPVSSTAVPLRFPFGHVPPQTPASLKERAHSFSSPLVTPGSAGPSPILPASASKTSRQGRPHSTEIRPLYLVERNRQTPEVDEALPSLPSSKPSSRASSIHGSDENYQSAAEEWNGAGSPTRRRALTVDIGEAQRWKDDGDVLGSQQTTPKASEFPQLSTERQHPKQEPQFYTWEDLAREGQKPQPQFYTWDDFAQDEKMHEENDRPGAVPQVAYRAGVSDQDLPPLLRSRSVSPNKKDGSRFKSVAAAAMLGTAAVYAGHKLSERSPERTSSVERNEHRGSYEPVEKDDVRTYPLPAPVEEETKEASRPEISRKGSKKKEGKKGKKSQQQDDEPEQPLERQNTDKFFDEEAQAEAGAMGPEPVSEVVASAPAIHRTDTDTFWREEAEAEEGVSHPQMEDLDASAVPPKENALDRFLHNEKDMEKGDVFASAAAHSMPVYTPQDVADERSGQDVRNVHDNAVFASSASHTLPVLPTPGEESTDRFLEEEQRMEDGDDPRASEAQDEERPGTSYKIPLAKAEPAPLVVEPRNVVVDHEQPIEIEPAPRLTRKQSKKAKKKQKAAALFTGEHSQDDESGPSIPEAVRDVCGTDEQFEPDQQARETQEFDEPIDIPTPVTAVETEPPISFGTHDFGHVAHQTSSSWHDAQSQAFSDSMLKPTLAETEPVDTSRELEQRINVDEPAFEAEAESFEPAVSKKKAKKDKKKKPPTWSEPDAEEAEPTQSREDDSKLPSTGNDTVKDVAIGAAIAGGAAVLVEGVESEFAETSKSKKKAKKDKKKKPPTWSEQDAEVDSPSEKPQIDEAEREADETRDLNNAGPSSEAAVQEPHEALSKFEEPTDEAMVSEEPSISEEPTDAQLREMKAPESATQDAFDAFAPVSRKKSKKDKKKAKQAFNWTDPEPKPDSSVDESLPAEAPAQTQEREITAPAEDNTLELEAESARDLADTIATGEIVPQDKSAKSALEGFAPAISKKKSKKDKKKRQTFDFTEAVPESEQSSKTEEVDVSNTADIESPHVEKAEDKPAIELASVDNEPQPTTEPSDVNATGAEIVQPEETTAKSMLEEFAPVSSKKKKQQSFDWTEPEPEATSLPESRDEPMLVEEPVKSTVEDDVVAGALEQEQSAQAPTFNNEDRGLQESEILAVNNETSAEAPDEPLKPALSRKQSKKDKKKRQSVSWEPQPETQQESTSAAETAATEEPATNEGFSGASQQVTEDRDTVETAPSRPEEVPLPEEAGDELFNATEVGETTFDDTTHSRDIEFGDRGAQESLQPTFEEPATADDTQKAEDPQEDFSWTPTSQKKSKKSKKTKQVAQETSQDEPAANQTMQDVSEQLGPEAVSKSWDDIVANERDATQALEQQESSTPAPQAEEEPAFAWTSSSKKKGKKGKRSRQQSLADTSTADKEMQPELASETQGTAPEGALPGSQTNADQIFSEPQTFIADDKVADQEIPSTVAIENEDDTETVKRTGDAQDNAETPAEQPEDDWWSFTSGSKKKRKGKKGNSSGTATPAEQDLAPHEQPSQIEVSKVHDATQERTLGADEPASDITPEPPIEQVEEQPIGSEDKETVPPTEEAQEEFSWAPSSKKKGKKGQKGRASVSETPVVEKSDPLEDWSVPAQPSREEETLEKSQDATGAPEPSFDNADDEWALPTSSKKKKKGKKSASGLPAPIADLTASEPSLEASGNHEEVGRSQDETFMDPIKTGAHEPHADLGQDTVMPDAPVADAERTTEDTGMEGITEDQPPATSTFNDVWAEEDIATTEDHDAVRDLMDDSRDSIEPSWTSSKKGKKKKKGKKGSIAEPKPDVGTAPNPEKDIQSSSIPTPTETPAFGRLEPSSKIEDQRSEEPLESTKFDDQFQAPAEEGEPESNAAEFWMPQTSKKKGKKGKKGKQQSLTEGPATPVDDKQETESSLPSGPVTRDASSAFEGANTLDSEKAAEPTLEADNREQDTTLDDWLAPQAGKKAKKGKKKQATFSFDEPETSDPTESKKVVTENETPSASISPPEESHESQQPTETEANDVWDVPAKGKKGKKAKKAKQVLSWADEATTESPEAGEPVPAAAADRDLAIPEISWEDQEDEMQDVDMNLKATRERLEAANAAINAMEANDTPVTSNDWPQQPLTAIPGTFEEDDGAKEVNTTKGEETTISAEPESSNQLPQDEDFGFPIKQSKKDKRGKKNRSSTTDPWAESTEATTTSVQDPEAEKDSSGGLKTAAIAAGAIAAGATLAGATNTETAEDDWPTFTSKKSKKAKKKDRKSGSSTPAFVQEEEPSGPSDVVDFAPKASTQDDQQTALPRDSEMDLAANTGLPEVSANEQRDLEEDSHPVPLSREHGDAWDEATRSTSPHHPSQDIDFTATVAAGLADSGFNPDMVINDPVFQRRASPEGAIAEADPEEGIASTTTKRRKNKKSPPSSGSPVEEPAFPAGDSLAADDFNSAISRGLQGTGFDPALLEKALAESQQSSKVVDEPDEFSFATSKRKKGKKGKKAQREEDKESAEEATTAMNTSQASEDPKDLGSAALTDVPKSDDQEAMDLSREHKDEPAEASRQGVPEGQAVGLLTVGRDEMDMDEMDRAYKAYKKNKRKQKKLKGASRAAGDNTESTAEETEQSAMVSETEGLSRNTTMEDVLGRSTTRQLAPEQTTTTSIEKPSLDIDKAVESANSATSPTSIVQSAFPGLERVKRRAPPKPEAREAAPENRSPSPPRADPAFGTAGMAAVVAAAARERKARKESETSREGPRGEPSWSFAALDGEGKREPGSPVVSGKEHQPIRDSGYQESARSTQRADRTSREIPQILSTSSSRDSLRKRRSLEPLHIPVSPDEQWEIKVPKKRSKEQESRPQESRLEEPRSRTPSAETPLKPTSKDRASYLFQSPPEGLAGQEGKSPQPMNIMTPKQQTDNSEYFRIRSRSRESPEHPAASNETTRDRSAFSPSSGPLTPRQALDSIPEEHHVGKRTHAEPDVGGPDQIKALERAETPQDIRTREQAISPSMWPYVTIPSGSMRSTSNPLSTDELINRLSWPSVDEHDDTINLDRNLGHRHSRPALPDPRSPSVMSNRSNTSGAHFRSPQELRSYSRNSNQSQASSTHSLRRVSLSGDLRAASRRGDAGSSVSGARASPITIPFEPPPTPPLNDDEVIDASASRAADMNDDIFQGYGDAQGSQISPTRPPSVRKRQSMHINDLESRVDQLVAENRALQQARSYAEQTNDTARDVNGQALQEAIMQRDLQIQEKDAEINKIKAMLQPLQEEIARLSEINGGLTEANRILVDDTNGRYATLQREHQEAHQNWQTTSRELDTVRSEHGRITSGMKDIIEAEIATALADKNAEILRLREQLDIAAEQIRALQVQIQSSKTSDFLMQRDEDYFDGSCQKLCQHVQQWVLRFSKLSDNRVCRLSTELNDDKIEARLDNAVLDGSDVDKLLGDRVRRRDVFMSVVMTMVWEYVFTRYLFGMDREQRQKLKALEKLLAEVGPPRAVAHWRATTLTLLSKRPTFESQCALDTEAVAHEIFSVLCKLLPPPSNAEQQLLSSLTKVIRISVDLSIEMRTQRAEYIMLPPLQPEYDTNGDLVRKVHFNASLMNERSGFFSSNEELAAEQAVVKIVLFPLVVKKGDEVGEGEEEIVVCPAQVLVQNDGGRGKKVVRVMSGAMEIDDPIRSRLSRHSLMSEAPGSVQF